MRFSLCLVEKCLDTRAYPQIQNTHVLNYISVGYSSRRYASHRNLFLKLHNLDWICYLRLANRTSLMRGNFFAHASNTRLWVLSLHMTRRIIRYFSYSLFICSEKSPERNGKSERKTIEVLSKMWSEQKAYVVFGERARFVQFIFCNISKLTKTYNVFWRFTDFPSCYNIVYLLEWMFKTLVQCQLLCSLCSIEMFYLISINNRTCLKYESWMNIPNAELCRNVAYLWEFTFRSRTNDTIFE